MSKVFTDVKVFMNACGQITPNKPIGRTDLSDLYRKLIKEEYDEFVVAYANKDETEELDACFDMIWVITGYMHARGWDTSAMWEEGAKSNLAKIDRNTGMVIRRPEDGKILKPEGWKTPNFKQFVE